MSKIHRRDVLKLGAGLSGAFLVENLSGCGNQTPADPGAVGGAGGTGGGAGGLVDAGGTLDASGMIDGAADAASPGDAGATADARDASDATSETASKPDGDGSSSDDAGKDTDAKPEDAPTGTADTGPTLMTRTPASIVKARRDELDIELRVLSGRLPTDLTGHAFMIAALPWGDGTLMVNGDGIMYRLDFGGATVPLKSRHAKTPCYYADHASTGTANAFKNAGLVRFSPTLGTRNEANTAFVRMKDRLLITFDAGRPHEIDPTTLDVVTPVGAVSEWKRSIPELFLPGPLAISMSGAHPFFDENTGELFAVNYGTAIPGSVPFTDIVRWDGQGKLERWSVVLSGGATAEIKQSMHQIGVSQDYLVLMDCAFAIAPLQFLIPNAPSVAPSPDSVIYIVKRADLKAGSTTVTAKKLVIPREGAHFTLDYENPSGLITMHFGHNDGADPAEWLRIDDVRSDNGAAVRSDLLGMLVTTSDVNSMGRYTIDGEAGTLLDTTLVHDMDATWLPAIYTHRGSMTPGRFEDIYWVSLGYTAELLTKRVYDLYANYPYRKVPLASLPTTPKQGTLFRLDVVTMKIADAYRVPAGRILSSPQFVPRAGKTGTREGYLVCSMVSDDLSWPSSSGDEFWIFDAANLAQGPLCRLAHPDLDLGFTLHTTWMDAIAKRTATYRIPVRDDFAAGLATQTQEIKTLFENEVFPHFP